MHTRANLLECAAGHVCTRRNKNAVLAYCVLITKWPAGFTRGALCCNATILQNYVVLRFASRSTNHDPISVERVRLKRAQSFNRPRKAHYQDEQSQPGQTIELIHLLTSRKWRQVGWESGRDWVDVKRTAERLNTEALSAADGCRCRLRSTSMQLLALSVSLCARAWFSLLVSASRCLVSRRVDYQPLWVDHVASAATRRHARPTWSWCLSTDVGASPSGWKAG